MKISAPIISDHDKLMHRFLMPEWRSDQDKLVCKLISTSILTSDHNKIYAQIWNVRVVIIINWYEDELVLQILVIIMSSPFKVGRHIFWPGSAVVFVNWHGNI